MMDDDDIVMTLVCFVTDSEQLAEPEFAGLWEKRPAFKPVGDTTATASEKTSRPKTCKASKMEQVSFFADL